MGANIKQKSKKTGVNPHGLTAKGAKHVLSQSYLAIQCPQTICDFQYYWNLNRAKVYDDDGNEVMTRGTYKEEELLAEGHRSALHAQNPLPACEQEQETPSKADPTI